MNKTEIGKLLTFVSGYDRRQVDPVTIHAWFAVPEIAAAEYEQAMAVAISHHSEPGTGYFDTRALVAGLRQVTRRSLADVAADVRSAKARGLIAQDWPKTVPLMADVMEKLTAARERDRQTAIRYRELGQAGDEDTTP